MRKTWVLDTETKGTGAHVVPLEETEPKPTPKRPRRRPPAPQQGEPRPRPKPRQKAERSAGPLPPGHVRKKSTGELGKVQAVDPKAGTATVLWLRQGRSSTVRLSEISRR
ncbi:MAG TPA: hypothetical protein VGF21_09425 [Thermoleophilaceae bacterium]